MKFSTSSILFLAHGIAAMPWSSGKSKAPISDVLTANEDITLRIKVSQEPAQKGIVHTSNFDICLKVCWPEKPTCPNGWHSKNMGSDYEACWTCCKAPNDDLQL
ncbi:hypothetical protein ACJ41O_009142 [Fusarium nematophilum]